MPAFCLAKAMKGRMSAFVVKLRGAWTLLVAEVRSLLTLPEREVNDFPFAISDVAQLHRLRADPAAALIDDATWKDMLVGPFCAELSKEVSIFGQHVLYQRLREGTANAVPESVRELLENPAQVKALHGTCSALRHADKEIATLLYEDARPPAPAWAGRTWALPFALIASIIAVAWSPLAWLAVFAVLYFLMANQMRYGDRVEQWERSMKALQLLLRVDSLLDPKVGAAGARINRALTRSSATGMVPGMRGYEDWFALANVQHYFKSVALVHENLALLRDCFTRVSNLEANVALARHLLKTPVFCWAVRSRTGAIALTNTVHPLLAQAQPLTLNLQDRGAFISGQNGVGKSTLLRTLGLNLIAARAFGFCYATSAVAPMAPVYSSMQSEDSLLGGESLYMAELRRAKELLAAADGPHPGVYIIDEIFRGTNHLESVSAAAAVLDVLAAKGMVVVSSHNLVLASLLAHRLDPLCVASEGAGRLAIVRGVLAHTNGIALLSARGFGVAVEANAGKVFDWLSAYLAHPADCDGVLAR